MFQRLDAVQQRQENCCSEIVVLLFNNKGQMAKKGVTAPFSQDFLDSFLDLGEQVEAIEMFPVSSFSFQALLAIMAVAIYFAIAVTRPLRMNAALFILFVAALGLAGWFYFTALTGYTFADLSLLLFGDTTFTGRTVIGTSPPKGQQMEDNYFGTIDERAKQSDLARRDPWNIDISILHRRQCLLTHLRAHCFLRNFAREREKKKSRLHSSNIHHHYHCCALGP